MATNGVHGLPFISVVVPALNAEGQIETCIGSLVRLDYPAGRREAVIVDNGSADRTAELISRYPVRYVLESRRGVGYARNAGIAASRGEIVAFTDTDCAVSTNWLHELAKQFVDDSTGAVAGAILPYPPATNAERYAARRRSHSELRPLGHPERPFGMTPNLAVRRDILLRIGMFDTRFPGGGWEDADLCWRLARETDFELRHASRAVVFHRYRTTAWDFFVQHYRYGYGLGLLHRKYRAELRWGWRNRALAYGELGRNAYVCVRASLRDVLTGRDERVFAYFDLLRSLGQRAGFVGAAFGGMKEITR